MMSTQILEVAVLSPYTKRQEDMDTIGTENKTGQIPNTDNDKISSVFQGHSENSQHLHNDLWNVNPDFQAHASSSKSVIETAESVNGHSSVSSMSCWSTSEVLASECSWLWGGDSQLTNESVVTSDVFLSAAGCMDEFHNLNFAPVSYVPYAPSTQTSGTSGVDNSNLNINTLSSNDVNGNENGQQPSLDSVLANIAESIYRLGDTEEGQGLDDLNQLFGLDIHPANSELCPAGSSHDIIESDGMSLESAEFLSAVSDAIESSELYTTGMSGLNRTDDGCGSVFSSRHGSRSSSSSDFINEKTSEESLADVEFEYSAGITKERKLVRKRISKVSKKGFAPPAEKLELPRQSLWQAIVSNYEDTESSWNTSNGESSSDGQHGISNSSVTSVASEQSELNPHSKPFIPRAHLSHYKSTIQNSDHLNYSRTGSLNHSQFNATKHVSHNRHFSDSGIGNITDITCSWDTINNTKDKSLARTLNDSAFPVPTPVKNISYNEHEARTAAKGLCLPDYSHSVPTEIPPYDCKLNHENNFVPIQSFSLYKLPAEIQTASNFEAILSISQRVVKLTVSKPSNYINQYKKYDLFFHKEESPPCYDHLGTGFVFQVDKEHIFIRTHTEVVATAEEAARTKVSLVITFPGGKQSSRIHFEGEKDGFEASVHSQTCVFKCKTPRELIPYLYLLKEVPVLNRSSLFNDSCYFTDSSPDNSALEREDVDQGTIQDHLVSDKSTAKKNVRQCSSSVELRNVETSETKRSNECAEISHPMTRFSNQQGGVSQNDGNFYTESEIHVNTIPDKKGHLTDIENYKLETNLNNKDNCVPYFGGDIPNTQTPGMNQIMNFVTYNPQPDTVWPFSNPISKNTENPFSYCDIDESKVRQAFESVESFEYPRKRRNSRMNNDNFAVPNAVGRGKQKSYNSARYLQTNKTSSPLAIMEKRLEARRKADNLDICPYDDQSIFGSYGVYSYFSSYAGDVISSLQPLKTSHHNLSPYAKIPDYQFWEYEGLVHAQNHHRHAYDRLYKPTTHWDIPKAVNMEGAGLGQTWTKTLKDNSEGLSSAHQSHDPRFGNSHSSNIWERRLANQENQANQRNDSLSSTTSTYQSENLKHSSDIFPEFNNVETYLGTWDRDLLSIEHDLEPMPDFCDFEAMVDHIVAESDSEDDSPKTCCQKTALRCKDAEKRILSTKNIPLYALIISHPHGGSKMVSIGLFSRHHHVGGDLYDTPTCMGSCGAPVIAFNSGGGAYVTHLVHAGTTKANDVYSGMGIMFF